MKHLYAVFLLLLLLAGCAEEESKAPSPEKEEEEKALLGFASITLSEELESDAQTVTVTHTYRYDATDRLTDCLTRQTTQGVGAIVLENATAVAYGESTVTMTDGAGHTLTYTLDAGGRAVACVRNSSWGEVRRYVFSYMETAEGKHYLAHVAETLDGASDPYSEIALDYSTPGTVEVTSMVDGGGQCFVLSLPAGEGVANVAQLPCLFLTELYPLSLHVAALYGRLLGDAYDILLAACEPADNAESGEYTTYTYETDAEGLPQRCSVVTESYGATYHRTLEYGFSR